MKNVDNINDRVKQYLVDYFKRAEALLDKELLKEIDEYVEVNFKSRSEIEMSYIIEYCRALQEQYIEHKGERSGESVLSNYVSEGILTKEMFMEILPAVISYKEDYKLINTDETK